MISFALRAGLQRAAGSSIRILTSPQLPLKNIPSISPASQYFILSRNSSAAGPLTATHTATHAKQKHEDHVGHWKIDRVVDVIMLPLIPAAFLTDNVYLNYALILAVGAHVHWGMESVVVDYMRPRIVGQAAYYVSLGLVYLLSFGTFAGLIYLNYSQLPPTKAIKKLWQDV